MPPRYKSRRHSLSHHSKIFTNSKKDVKVKCKEQKFHISISPRTSINDAKKLILEEIEKEVPDLLTATEKRRFSLFYKGDMISPDEFIGDYSKVSLENTRKQRISISVSCTDSNNRRVVVPSLDLSNSGTNMNSAPKLRSKCKSPRKVKTPGRPFSKSLGLSIFSNLQKQNSESDDDKEGQVKIFKKIGSGACSQVYAVSCDGWNCAMKEIDIIEPQDLANPQFSPPEVDVLSKLPKHNHLIKFLSTKRTPKTYRIFLQQYHGSLDQEISERKKGKKKFTPLEVVSILCDVISGLDCLHSNNIIHRDIKSHNIFYEQIEYPSPRRNYIIGDFDSAKIISKNHQPSDTIGTPSFMAPEILSCKNRNQYSLSADIFSFGMLIYELLCLNMPYSNLKSFEVADAILNGKKPKISKVSNEYAPIIDIHKECININPDERPTSEQLLTRLKFLHSSLTVTKRSPQPTRKQNERA